MLWDSYTRPANLDDGDDGWVRGPEVLPLSIHPRSNVDSEMVCVSGRCLRMRAEQQGQNVTVLGKWVPEIEQPALLYRPALRQRHFGASMHEKGE